MSHRRKGPRKKKYTDKFYIQRRVAQKRKFKEARAKLYEDD